MATIYVFNEAENKTYTVTVDVFGTVVDKLLALPTDGDIDYYLKISTTMRKAVDNSAFPVSIIRTLNDVPPGYLAATDFTDLIENYIEYYMDESELGASTSSSSTSSKSSSSSSSTSSSSKSSSSTSSKSSSSTSSKSTSSSSSTSSSTSSSYIENWSSSSSSSSP